MQKYTKKWFARQLGLAVANERFAAVWDQIGEDGNLPQTDEPDDWDFALEQARRLLAYEEKRGTPIRRQRKSATETAPILEDAEGRRANAMMLYWAKCAACEQSVRDFRERVLNNRLLTLQEAYEFLSSPVISVFSQREIEASKVPVVGHSAAWKRRNGEMVKNGFYWHIVVEVQEPAIEMRRDRIADKPLDHLWYPGEDGWGRAADVWPGSVMDYLLQTSTAVADRYGWGKGQAPMFILTDIVPLTHALAYSIEPDALGRQSITMTIEPWVTKGTVLRAYHQAQRKVYESVPGPIGEQNAAIFEFVIERMDVDGKIPSIRSLMDAWNHDARTRDEWKYDDPRLFERDYNRAKTSLLHPKLRTPLPIPFDKMTPADQIVHALLMHSDNHVDNQERPEQVKSS